MFEGKEESRPDGDNQEIHFFYNQNERLKRAPKEVQDYYNGKFELQKGVKVLFKNRANRFFLITMVVLTAFAMFLGRFDTHKTNGKLGGYKAELSAFSFEESVYVNLKFDDSKKDGKLKDPKTFYINFTALNSDSQVVFAESTERLMSKDEDTVAFKITDFEICQINADIIYGNEKLSLQSGVRK